MISTETKRVVWLISIVSFTFLILNACGNGDRSQVSEEVAEVSSVNKGETVNCQTDADCGFNQVCDHVFCDSFPCPGICRPNPSNIVCKNDNDCEAGLVCEPTEECGDVNNYRCVSGCHNDAQCGANQVCDHVFCDTCPCPGKCRPILTCENLNELQCKTTPGCQAGYRGICDCTCPGPKGYEGGGCEGCAANCFGYVGCVSVD